MGEQPVKIFEVPYTELVNRVATLEAEVRDLESRVPSDFQQALEDEFEKGREEGYAERKAEEEGLGVV